MSTMWDTRYDREDYVFGTAPADFLATREDLLKQYAGKSALAVADGEGRNSVFMAQHGLNVTAMDNSEVGLEKARRLADANSVSVDLQLADVKTWDWAEDSFDMAVAIFIQFADPAFRTEIFDASTRLICPAPIPRLAPLRASRIALDFTPKIAAHAKRRSSHSASVGARSVGTVHESSVTP